MQENAGLVGQDLFKYAAVFLLLTLGVFYFLDFVRLCLILIAAITIPYLMFQLHYNAVNKTDLYPHVFLSILSLSMPFLVPVTDEGAGLFLRYIVATTFGAFVIGIINIAISDIIKQEGYEGFYSACFGVFSYTTNQEREESDSYMVRHRLRRSGFKFIALLALIWFTQGLPFVHESYYLSSLYLGVVFYLVVTMVCDFVLGLLARYDVKVGDPFQNVLISSSPSDFWARRWNRPMNKWFRRNFYLTLSKTLPPAGLVLVVFCLSGLIHQFPIWLGGGGVWLVFGFFMVHAIAVIAHRSWLKVKPRGFLMPHPIAVTLHHLWLLTTLPLFFVPLSLVLPFDLIPEHGILISIFASP